MKLRNKKTGDIWEFDSISMRILDTSMEKLKARGWSGSCFANSISELNEEWEDYKPAEPLIKDEKIRKAVRAWAEACNLKHVSYKQASNEFYDADTRNAFLIRFMFMPVEVYIEDGECYTIAELCGEEEE